MSRLRRLLQEVAARDSAFERRLVRGAHAWVGRCIHCRRAIVVPENAREPASATLEHIIARTHGGSDELDNLALACASCNHEKGRKLDARRRDDPVLQRVIEQLRAELARRKRA